MPKKLPTKPRLPKLFAPATRPRGSNKKKGKDPEFHRFACDLVQQRNDGESPLGLTRSQRIISELTEQCPGSSRGVRRLVNLATEAIHQLEQLWRDGNRHLKEVAKGRIDWPVLTAHHTAILQKNSQLIQDIGLGRDAFTREFLEQLPARETRARQQARRLLLLVAHIQNAAVWGECIHEDLTRCDDSFLQLLRLRLSQNYTPTIFRTVILNWPLVLQIKQLPYLTPDEAAVARWQKATLELLLLNCDGDPAAIPKLCALGVHRRYHPYPKTTPVAIKRALVSMEKQRKNVNREIREILNDAIRMIADHIHKLMPTTE